MQPTTQATIAPCDASAGGLRWHLVLTKPLGERVATLNLERQGYRVYFPRVRQKVLRRQVWSEAIASLFPRYLFVQLNASVQTLAPIRSTLGVSAIVRFGTEYAIVPDCLVNGLIGRADPQSGLHSVRKSPSFAHGAAVRFISGALRGIDGIFESEDANDRVTVLLNLLGRETRIRVPASSIVPR